ncbi:fasciclin domain-containing protein [Niabella sp.]|uniref:fasciclin domain-containing protein n=1 Tax=Niabella sp. TaxID=1962976 RepID=UPI002601E1A1|nr:fasciclin domain-containing protein [Niabella sp.]
MRFYHKFFKKTGFLLLAMGWLLQACNKDLPEAVPITPEKPAATETILQKLNAPEFSILKTAVEKASTFASTTGKLTDLLGNTNGVFTFFAPDNTAIYTSFSLLGLPADASSLNFFSAGQLDSMLKYHLIGGTQLTSSVISSTAPALNMYLQSMLVLAQPSASLPPGYRMPIFMGKQGPVVFVNNVPVKTPDIMASNGVMHKVAVALLPPDKVLWQTIAANAGGSYTYFKAAVIRADGGESATGQFQSALSNPTANFTALVPTNTAFEQLLIGQITKVLLNKGVPGAVAVNSAEALVAGYGVTLISNPASVPVYGPDLAAVITPQLLQGVVAYHLLIKPGTTPLGYRDFTVNFPTDSVVNVPTLVNASVPAHPGVGLRASFSGATLNWAIVKGLGNGTAANIILNAPPSSTNDLNHINGVLHRIDQVLLPQ